MPRVKSWLYVLVLLLTGLAGIVLLNRATPVITQAVAITDGKQIPLDHQPYALSVGHDGMTTLQLTLLYEAGQNTAFVLELPDLLRHFNFCAVHIWVNAPVPHTDDRSLNKAPLCDSARLDLQPYLHPGSNDVTLLLQANMERIPLTFYPQFFGVHPLSTLGCVLLFGVAAVLIFHLACLCGLTAITSVITALGMLYYATWLHFRPDLAYTSDMMGHLEYILYMADSWMRPYQYFGHEYFHPPAYYFLAAMAMRLSQLWHVLSPFAAVRMFSLSLYMVFCLYALRTLHDAVERKRTNFYVGVLLIMFWPLAVDSASSMNNDMPQYAIWAASFYYLTDWFRTNRLRSLRISIGLVGIAFMFKSALILAGIVGAVSAYGLLIRRLGWRELTARGTLLAYAVVVFGVVCNFGRIIHFWITTGLNSLNTYFGMSRDDVYPLSYFTHFDVMRYLLEPYVTFKNGEPTFLNYFLKTFLFSPWNRPKPFMDLPTMLNGAFLVFLSVAFFGVLVWLARNWKSRSELMPYLIALVMCVAGIIGFLLVEKFEHCQNFRYILPGLVPLVILYVRGMDAIQAAFVERPLYWTGLASALFLCVGSIVLFLHKGLFDPIYLMP